MLIVFVIFIVVVGFVNVIFSSWMFFAVFLFVIKCLSDNPGGSVEFSWVGRVSLVVCKVIFILNPTKVEIEVALLLSRGFYICSFVKKIATQSLYTGNLAGKSPPQPCNCGQLVCGVLTRV